MIKCLICDKELKFIENVDENCLIYFCPKCKSYFLKNEDANIQILKESVEGKKLKKNAKQINIGSTVVVFLILSIIFVMFIVGIIINPLLASITFSLIIFNLLSLLLLFS